MTEPMILPLLDDGALRLEFDGADLPLLAAWLPLLPPHDGAPAALATIRLGGGVAAAGVPATKPTLRLAHVRAWVDADAGRGVLHGAAGAHGFLALAALRADLSAGAAPLADAAAEIYSMTTISAALLLGRLRRALIHAAAVVSPAGGCWLLPGDTHAGKSTACANLLRAGWSYVSDDQVVLSRSEVDARLWVEGWPRRFHLDSGWQRGEVHRHRDAVDPRRLWPGQWLRRAPLAGILLPAVEAHAPTRLLPATPADALAALLRQSPWLLADPAAAPALLELLAAAAHAPVFHLRAGRDSYASPERLLAVLQPLATLP